MAQIHLKNPSLLKTTCLINNEWVASDVGQTIAVDNPFTGEKLADIPLLNEKQIQQAIEHATAAQVAWAKKTANERAVILHAWADLIDQNKDDLAVLMTAEQGKPITEATGEIGYANSFIRWFAEESKRIYGDIIPSTHPDLRYTVIKQPVGVCAAITPWNFPAAMITRKVAPALAAGCAILVKPALETPLSAFALGELAIQAGLPAGVLQIVTGENKIVGDILTSDPRIAKLSFTGSTQVGRQLMAQCAGTIKKLSLELGGNAPFIIFEDADLEKAADGLIASKFRNAGQTCVCANRIYVQDSIMDKFLAIFIPKVEALKVGNGMDKDTQISCLINDKALKKVTGLLGEALNHNATILTGGKPHPASKLSFTPTVITDIDLDCAIASQEIFGPVAAIYPFSTEKEVIDMANNTIFGLAAYFYTTNLARSYRVMEQLEYGMVAQNTGILSTEVAPFGGVKQSGFGREGSKYGIEDYVNIKYWCLNAQD